MRGSLPAVAPRPTVVSLQQVRQDLLFHQASSRRGAVRIGPLLKRRTSPIAQPRISADRARGAHIHGIPPRLTWTRASNAGSDGRAGSRPSGRGGTQAAPLGRASAGGHEEPAGRSTCTHQAGPSLESRRPSQGTTATRPPHRYCHTIGTMRLSLHA